MAVIAVIIASGLVTARITSPGGEPSARGCLTSIILVGNVVQGLAISAYLTFIMPIILGGNRTTPLSFIGQYFGTVMTAAVVGLLAMFFTAFIPIVGRAQSVGAFVQGVVVCRLLADPALQEVGKTNYVHPSYPGVMASAGFILIAVVLTKLSIVGLATIAAVTSQTKGESVVTLLAPAIGVVFGLLPAFMYMRYAVISLRV